MPHVQKGQEGIVKCKLWKNLKKKSIASSLSPRRSKEVNEDVNNLKWLRGYDLRWARASPGEEK